MVRRGAATFRAGARVTFSIVGEPGLALRGYGWGGFYLVGIFGRARAAAPIPRIRSTARSVARASTRCASSSPARPYLSVFFFLNPAVRVPLPCSGRSCIAQDELLGPLISVRVKLGRAGDVRCTTALQLK